MNRILILVSYILCVLTQVNAQSNLVLNPSFENHLDTFDIGIASFSRNYVTDWSDPNQGSSDYFIPHSRDDLATPPSNIFGFEYPHSGYAYGGFIFYYGPTSLNYEYVQASFTNPLQGGKTYALESFVSLGYEGQSFCLSDLGFYFSDTLVSEFTGEVINVIPQYENPASNMINTHHGWQRIQGTYTAHGGEKYLSIGLFKPYSITHLDTCDAAPGSSAVTYLFLDDVAVYDTSQIDTIHLCMNDSVLIGGSWHHNAGLYTDIIGGLPVNFYIKPRSYSTNLTIIDKPFESGDSVRISLLQTFGNDSSGANINFIWASHDTTIDIPMFNVYGCDSTVRYRCGTNIGTGVELDNKFSWNIYPNPANDFIMVRLSKNDPAMYSVTIIDIAGHEVLSNSLTNDKIDISALKSGMYFIKLINTKTGNVVGTEKFVKSY